MGNGCSVSGGWFRKALEHEYIDKRVLLVVTLFFYFLFFVGFCGAVTGRKEWVQFLGLHRWLEGWSELMEKFR